MKFILPLLVFTSLFASDGFDDDFNEDLGIKLEHKNKTMEMSPLSINTSTNIFSSYNYSHDKVIQNDFSGFSSLKAKMDIDIDYKIGSYKIKSNIKVLKEHIYLIKKDSYPIQPKEGQAFSINKLYVQGSLSENIDFKIGRQIVSWGKSDYIKIADIINPANLSSIGIGDIKDSKLGRGMGKIDYFMGNYTFSAIAIMENRFSILPSYGSDFAPQLPPKNNMGMRQRHKAPANNIENMGIAISALGEFNAQDIALYYANLIMDGDDKRSNMFAIAYNKAINKFLIKNEIAYFDHEKDTINALVGVDYKITNGVIGIELANKDNNILYTGVFNKKYLNDTLDFSLLYVGLGENIGNNGMFKSILGYKINDNISANIGLVEYLGEDIPQFIMLKDNDRIFANITYNASPY